MKPAMLVRHLKSKHFEFSDKSIEFFKIKSNEMKNSKNKIEKIATGTTNEKATIASYAVSLLIAKSGKPYKIRAYHACCKKYEYHNVK
jgi:hypothetical protein